MSQIKIKRGAIGYAKGRHHGHTKHVVSFRAGDGSFGGVGFDGSRRQCFREMRRATAPGVAMTVRRPRAYDKPVDA